MFCIPCLERGPPRSVRAYQASCVVMARVARQYTIIVASPAAPWPDARTASASRILRGNACHLLSNQRATVSRSAGPRGARVVRGRATASIAAPTAALSCSSTCSHLSVTCRAMTHGHTTPAVLPARLGKHQATPANSSARQCHFRGDRPLPGLPFRAIHLAGCAAYSPMN